jgi:micrococcal nuclease
MRKRHPRLWVLPVLALAAFLVSGCGGGSGSSGGDIVDWSKASQYVGKTKTVEGPVLGAHIATKTRGQPTFLNVGRDYPDPARFTVLIWGSDRSKFPKPPETMYVGHTIRVKGEIVLYKGAPEIVVRDPRSIEIIK